MPPRGRTVLVLGAGASLAEALDRRPKRTRDHPPLDANFFARAAAHRSSPLLRRVERQAARLGETRLTASNPSVGLESYLGRLFFEINHNPLRASVRAYFEAVELYAREVIETTNWMIGRPGLMKKLLQHELRAGQRVDVVTFNIDLLMENTLDLLASGRPGAAWSIEEGYGFGAPPETANGVGMGDEFEVTGPADIRLFKMHGSVNWVFKHRDEYPPADLVSKRRDFYVVTHKRMPSRRIELATPRGGRPWYTFPLLVPPVYEKHGLIKRHLQQVWEGAEEALRGADKVIFWGYSFPLADTHARHFFQGLAHENGALRRPVLINPDPLSASALWAVLRPKRLEHYRAAADFLADPA